MSRVQHPGIVSAFEFGHTSEGTPYIVMEFLPGSSLRQRLSQLAELGGRLEPGKALRILHKLAAALSAAHQSGIIHRTPKPTAADARALRRWFRARVRRATGSGSARAGCRWITSHR